MPMFFHVIAFPIADAAADWIFQLLMAHRIEIGIGVAFLCFLYVGIKGFTARGLPIGKGRTLAGTAGKIVGTACLLVAQTILLFTALFGTYAMGQLVKSIFAHWILIGPGAGFLYIGFKGFTAKGLPIIKGKNLAGRAGKVVGGACIFIGMVIFLVTVLFGIAPDYIERSTPTSKRPETGTVVIAANAGTGGAAPASQPKPVASARYQGHDGAFALSFSPDVWTKLEKSANPAAEVTFVHRNREAFAHIICEQLDGALVGLRDFVVRKMKSTAGEAEVVKEEKKVVNGEEGLCLTINTKFEGKPYTYYVYLYSGGGHCIQVMTWTGQAAFNELKPDLDSFLNGFEVMKK